MHTILFLEVTDAAWVKIRPTAVFSKRKPAQTLCRRQGERACYSLSSSLSAVQLRHLMLSRACSVRMFRRLGM